MDEKQTELQLCDMPTPPFWLLVSPGELAEFSKSLEVCEDLKLMGTVGPEDLIAIWNGSFIGHLVILDLEDTIFYTYVGTFSDEAEVTDKDLLPDFSFFHPEEQIDAESMSVTPIKLQKLVSSAMQTTIGKYAYAYATNLEELIFPIISQTFQRKSDLQYIGDGAFIGCTKLPKLELSPGVLEIGAFAFKDCTSLTDVYLPASLTKIGDKCFKNCSSIATIYCEAPEPPVCTEISEERGEGTFFGVPADAEIFVPVGSKELYANAPGWSHFTNIQEYESADIPEIETVSANSATEIYDLRGVKVGTTTDGLDSGIYLVRQGDKVEKIAVK